MKRFTALIIMLVVLAAIGTVSVRSFYQSPCQTATSVDIPHGMGGLAVARRLTDSPLQAWSCYLMMRLGGAASKLKSGEYAFPSGLSREEMVEAISRGGYRIAHRVAVVEGATVASVLENLQQCALVWDVMRLPPEGMIYPDTYVFYKGDQAQKLLDVMAARMRAAVAEAWAKRDSGLRLKNPYELLVLASIIEKETGVGGERGHISAVFHNRLNLGMPLQSDPTVIYGLTQGGKVRFGRALTRDDLAVRHGHNTYVHKGLPPTPIAVPSLAALQAAAHPDASRDLYFVADGTGGHVFSRDLSTHQKHHRKWRRIRKSQKKPIKQ